MSDSTNNITYSPEIDFTSEKKIEIDNVAGFNSDIQNNYEKFDSDPVNAVKNLFKDYIALTVNEFSDKIGRDFFYINAPNSPPISIVVFETAKDTMISINNVVMTMKEFLSVKNISTNRTSSEVPLADIRQDVSWKDFSKVVCRSEANVYELCDISIPTLTTIITIMNKKYGYLYEDSDDDEYEDDEDEEEEDVEEVEKEVNEVQKEEVGLIRRFIRWIY
jgi:hypothetical protein